MELSGNAYRVLVGRPEDNIKMDLQEVGCDAGDWIHLAQDGRLT